VPADVMAQLLQGHNEASGSEEIKMPASAAKDLGQEPSAIKTQMAAAPIRRSRRSARQQTDKVRTASSSSTSSAQSLSSASSGNGSSSDTVRLLCSPYEKYICIFIY